MPAAFSHILLLDEVIRRTSDAELLRIVAAHPKAAAFGSLGPDILFFHGGPDAASIFRDAIDKVVRPIELAIEIVKNVRDWTSEIITNPVGARFRQLTRNVEDFCYSVEDTLEFFVGSVANPRNYDPFEQFLRPPMCDDYRSGSQWTWIDVAHHKRTGNLFEQMWEMSDNIEVARAYAIGYLTHITGDLIGHAYINRLVGGPYRKHWRRHIFIERILDAELWGSEGIEFSNAGSRIDMGDRLPDELAYFLQGAFQNTYAGQSVPEIPTAENFRTMYSRMLKSLKFFSNCGMSPPDPMPPYWDQLDDELKEVFATLASVEPHMATGFTLPDSVEDAKRVFKTLVAIVRNVMDVLRKFLAKLVQLIATLVAAVIALCLWLIKYLLYTIYVFATFILALAGFIWPHRPHMGFMRSLLDTGNRVFYPNAELFNDYPQNRPVGRLWEHARDIQVYHIFHPANLAVGDNVEPTEARPGVRGQTSFEDCLLRLGNNFYELSRGMNQAAAIRRIVDSNEYGTWGSAAAMAAHLLAQLGDGARPQLPNWNLDSDRGFNWPEWSYTSDIWPISDEDFSLRP